MINHDALDLDARENILDQSREPEYQCHKREEWAFGERKRADDGSGTADEKCV